MDKSVPSPTSTSSVEVSTYSGLTDEHSGLINDRESAREEISIESTEEITVVKAPELSDTGTEASDSDVVPAEDSLVVRKDKSVVRTPNKVVVVPSNIRSAPAEMGWRGLWNMSLGRFLPKLNPSANERAFRQAASTIQSATWERPMNVVVANVKGGSGKTLATVMLAEVLSELRGGQVAAWEACEVRGTLADRVGGVSADKGIPQFLEAADSIASLHDASQYLAVQASHAHALASPRPRAELDESDVATMRRVLDTYFALTITDTGNNALHPAWHAAVTAADVLVIPCTTSADSVKGALDTLTALDGFEDPAISSPETGLRSRVVVVASSPAGADLDSGALDPLQAAGVRVVRIAPFDKTLAKGTTVSIQDLNAATRRAWTHISADVVVALTAAPEIEKTA